MVSYSVRDVERVLRLSRGTIRGLVDVGFVSPSRGPRRELRFSFQDLILMRAARALIQAKVSRKRILRSLEDLRKHLPDSLPLSGLSISAVGDRVVVREGGAHWQVDDGQYVLGLDVKIEAGELRVVERLEPKPLDTAFAHMDDDPFSQALDLEETAPEKALLQYEKAAAADPEDVAPRINQGRLLHTLGRMREAEDVYRDALGCCGADSLLMYNLGVLLEDTGRTHEALNAYHAAISEDPDLADCHFNLARLYESAGQSQHAIRHFGQYRRLITAETR